LFDSAEGKIAGGAFVLDDIDSPEHGPDRDVDGEPGSFLIITASIRRGLVFRGIQTRN
jgi:hypothetical protein